MHIPKKASNLSKTFLLFVTVSFGFVSTSAQTTNRMTIEELRQVRLPDVAIETVKHVDADTRKNSHALSHAEVNGVIGGTIRFELLLPDAWNGRFVMGGGGGFVGTVQNSSRDSVNQGYATIGTDTGHQWPEGHMAGWALTNLEAQVNFAFLAVHRTAEVGKALIRSYYHSDTAYSYFLGCSRGGGQAMMEAQHYPKDFDGIVAGAPAFNWTGIAATMVQIAKALYPNPNDLQKTVLNKEALQTLAKAIIEQCDTQDGLKDGIIADPPSAKFDLSKVEGLSNEQRNAIEAIYRGAANDKGAIYPGFSPVAECDPDQWMAWLVGPMPAFVSKDHAADLTFAFGTQIFKYLVFNNPDWDYSTYDFSHFTTDTRLAASFLNATNPNLDQLKARNVKLIIWHGWADPALPAQGTVNYYREALAHDPKLEEYCRLFLVPGCLHCGGGPGASEVDWLSAIVNWVEHATAPDRVIALKHDQAKLRMSRPLFPFPGRAEYKGAGDPNNADSFEMKTASPLQ
jgi:feruloyl esterase